MYPVYQDPQKATLVLQGERQSRTLCSPRPGSSKSTNKELYAAKDFFMTFILSKMYSAKEEWGKIVV